MSTISSGTTSTTTLVHSGDTTGSLVFKTNDTGSGGTEAARFDTSQNLLVGTTSATFTYTGSSTATAKQTISTSGYDCINLISTGANPGIDFSQPNSASTIYRYANITGVMTTTTAGSESGALIFATGNAGANSAERMRIDSSGNLLVGTTSALSQTGRATFDASANGLVVRVGNSSTAYQSTNTSGTGAYYGAIWSNNGNTFSTCGTIQVSGTTTSYNTSSDYRLKENVQPMQNALAKVAQLNPVTYKWKSDGSDGQGFIAHELQAIFPDAVSGEKDGLKEDGSIMPQGVDTSFLVATLVASIQELKQIVDAQATEIAELKAKVK